MFRPIYLALPTADDRSGQRKTGNKAGIDFSANCATLLASFPVGHNQMLYIAVTPAGFYALLLLAAIGYLAMTCRKYGLARPKTVLGLFIIPVALAAFAAASMWFNAQRSISREACISGIYGSTASAVIFAIGAVFLVFLYVRRRPIFDGDRQVVFAGLLCVGVACLACLRSALLCTV